MRAITVAPDHTLHVADVLSPAITSDSLRIAVRATAVNRADLLQRAGRYPPPPGASEILGLECAGTVAEIGANVSGWRIGERAMALLAGGGYAEEVVVHAGSAIHVPDGLSDDEAAAIPEVFLTAFLNLFLLAELREGESVLIHGGGSGVGTAGTTLAKLAGARVIVTAGSAEKCALCVEHGADVCIQYRDEDFVEKARGVNVILDHIGARYLARDLDALALDGRIVVIGGDADRDLATAIAATTPGAIDATGRLSLLASAELIRRSALLVTNDSLPQHLASAMGTRTVTVFGPTVPGFGFGPLAPRSASVGHESLPCRPCHPHGPPSCPLSTSHRHKKRNGNRHREPLGTHVRPAPSLQKLPPRQAASIAASENW